MAPPSDRFPSVPSSHPILAHCASEVEARQIEDLMRDSGLSCIRIDRESASLRTGHPVAEAAIILVSREDYAKARQLLARSGLPAAAREQPESA
ncbi:MAG: DUF2007 domain-containing protein [Bryobacterales bacterium]|nr:DUF2007 domain-containing protein [Bryobacterales bacterium]